MGSAGMPFSQSTNPIWSFLDIVLRQAKPEFLAWAAQYDEGASLDVAWPGIRNGCLRLPVLS